MFKKLVRREGYHALYKCLFIIDIESEMKCLLNEKAVEDPRGAKERVR
jgi:hypothetical protein